VGLQPSSYCPVRRFETLLRLKEEGRTRAIGVANFSFALLETVVEEIKAPIACNQVEYHVMLDQTRLRKYLSSKAIPLVAYCPLAQGRTASDEMLAAIGRKHGASVAQVALKWLLDQDGVVAIPKASRAESQRANLDALHVGLDDEDRQAIRGVAERQALRESRLRAGVGLVLSPLRDTCYPETTVSCRNRCVFRQRYCHCRS
jgi:2,5-diketo-D-gluconate reductase B